MRVLASAVFPNKQVAEEVRNSLLLRNLLPHHIIVEPLWPSAAAVLGPYLGLPATAAEPYEAIARDGGVLVGVRVQETLREGVERLFEQRGGTVVSQPAVADSSAISR